MSRATWMIVGASAAVLALTGCKTTETGGGVKPTPDDKETGPKKVATAAPGDKQPAVSAKAQRLFDDAVKAFDDQKKARKFDYPALEKKFRAASDADPALAEADYNLGVLAERQGKTKEAAELYKSALSRKPTLHQAAENLAVIAQNQGDEKAAVAIYEDILANYPDDASSRARLAEIYRRRGENDKAMELARAALFRDPKTAQAYKTMMLVSFDQKQFSMTRLIALRAARLDDSDPEIPYTLGLINLAEKDRIKARVQFKKAIELRPDFLPARHQLLKMAFDQEDYVGAEEHLRRILQANGNNPEALLDLGVAYKGMGQYDKAMQVYDAVQKLKPDMPELYLNRGTIIGIKGEPEKAITYFKQYISLKPGAAADDKHPVHQLIKDQEAVIQHREDEKRKAEEEKKAIEEAKKMEAAALEEAKKMEEEELKKKQAEAKGNVAKDALKDEPKPDDKKGASPDDKKAPAGKDNKPPEAKKDDAKTGPAASGTGSTAAPKKDEKAPAPAPKKDEKKAPEPAKKPASGDEPQDAL